MVIKLEIHWKYLFPIALKTSSGDTGAQEIFPHGELLSNLLALKFWQTFVRSLDKKTTVRYFKNKFYQILRKWMKTFEFKETLF